MRSLTILFLATAFAASVWARPHVVIVSMGGTIASKASTRMNLTNYGGPGNRVNPEDWLADVPELQDVALVTTEDFRQPEGVRGGMTISQWYLVAQRLQEMATDDSIDGIVVTHGTNTMAETAWFMDLTVSIKKPVVFVGSQRPWSGLSGDGPLNLYNAVRVAATPEAGGMGVLHVMNDTINAARDLMKTIAYRVQTFESVDTGPLGYTDSDRIVFYRAPLRKHTFQSEFSIKSLPETLPLVEIAYAYTEAPGYIIDAMIENGVKGIIVDGTGAGSPTGAQTEALKKAQAAGIVVVATTRTRSGRVQDTPRRREANIIPGDNFQPEKARTLLQLALTKTTDLEEITRIFSEY